MSSPSWWIGAPNALWSEAAVRFQRQAIEGLPPGEQQRARARLALYEKREPWRR